MPKELKPARRRKFDPEFRFVLALDPALEGWRAWAAQWWSCLKNPNKNHQAALTQFFVHYLHGHGLHVRPPAEFFAAGTALPDLDAALGLEKLSATTAKRKHDIVCDFLDWVLRTKLAESDAHGHRVVPAHLANPFPRMRHKQHGKQSDLTFAHVPTLDPRLDDWRQLAAEWLREQTAGVSLRRTALDKFLVDYLHGRDLERNPVKFLLRETPKPDFTQVLVASRKRL